MKCSYDKIFTLTTSLAVSASRQKSTACYVQSALETVLSVECGLFAKTPALGILCKEL